MRQQWGLVMLAGVLMCADAAAGQARNRLDLQYIVDDVLLFPQDGQVRRSGDRRGYDLRGEFGLLGPFDFFARYELSAAEGQLGAANADFDIERIEAGVGLGGEALGLDLQLRIKAVDMDIRGRRDLDGAGFELAIGLDSDARELNLDPGTFVTPRLTGAYLLFDDVEGYELEAGVDVWFAPDFAGTVSYRLLRLDAETQLELESAGYRIGVRIGY